MTEIIFFPVFQTIGETPQNIFEVSLDRVFNQPSILLEDNIEKMEEKIENRHTQQVVKPMRTVVYRSFLKLKREKMESYTTKLIEPEINPIFKTLSTPNTGINGSITINQTICTDPKKTKNKNQFCCKFHVKMTSVYTLNSSNLDTIVTGDNFTNYYYRLAVYDGVKHFSNHDLTVPGNIQVCGIVPCLNKKVDSCGLRTDNSDTESPKVATPATVKFHDQIYVQTGAIFEEINIESVVNTDDSNSYPIFLHRSSTPNEFGGLSETGTYEFSVNRNISDHIVVNLETNKVITNLGSVAILTRVYHVPSSSTKINFSYVLLIIPLFCNRFFLRENV